MRVSLLALCWAYTRHEAVVSPSGSDPVVTVRKSREGSVDLDDGTGETSLAFIAQAFQGLGADSDVEQVLSAVDALAARVRRLLPKAMDSLMQSRLLVSDTAEAGRGQTVAQVLELEA